MSNKQINTNMSDSELQAFLNKKNKDKLTYIILVAVGVVIAIFGSLIAFPPIIFIGVALAGVFIFLMSKVSKEMKRFVSENVVRSVINTVFDNVFYDPFGRLSDAVIKNTELGFSSFNINNPPDNAGGPRDMGSIPALGRYPE